MGFNPNPQQKSAIRARGNILVSAAAGSGKTAVLVQRVIQRILDSGDPVDADRMLIVTFTNAAAAEMKQRISAGIAERLRQSPGDPALMRQRALLAGAPICTMDSYCLQLVREHFHKLDVPPDFKIADAGLLRILEAQAMDQVLEEAFDAGEPEFHRLLEYLGADQADYALKTAVEKIYVYLRSLPFPDEWAEMALGLYRQDLNGGVWTGILLNQARHELSRLRDTLGTAEAALTARETDGLRRAVQTAQTGLRQLLEAADGGYEALRAALEAFVPDAPRRSRKLEEFSGVAEAHDAFGELKCTVQNLRGLFGTPLSRCEADLREMAPAVEFLFSLVRAYWQRLDDLKAARRILDFADIEYKALRLLVDKSGGRLEYTRTAKELSQHFREVLVDEYQDTNDLQDTILTALSGGGDNLFLVGDVKQSIYRFRKANPDNFLRRYREFPDYAGAEPDYAGAESDCAGAESDCAGAESDYAGAESDCAGAESDCAGAESDHAGAESDYAGTESDCAGAESDHAGAESDYAGAESGGKRAKILLSENYRSRTGICDYVNFTFRLLMTRAVGDIDYADREKLVPAAEYPARGGADVSLHLLDLTECEERDITVEARLIADRILALCADPDAVTDGENPGGTRRARFSDFAVLLRSPGGRQAAVAAELTKRGIPVWMSAEGGFLNAVEIATTLAFLRVVDNPLREVHLLAAMHSPLFGFTPDRLAGLRADYPKCNFYRAVLSAAAAGETDCAAFARTLSGFRRLSATLPADALLRRIYDETNYYTLVQAMENGAQRRANLLLLLEYARGFEGAGFRGLSSFLRFIDRLDPEAPGLSPAGVATEEDDVVRIMSIHRSKGLQFPICILAGCSGRFNHSDHTAPMVLHEKYGVGLKIIREETRTRYSTLPREAVAIETKRAGISEELRVLYVAMTRAKERLMLFVSLKNPEKRLSKLASALGAGYSGAGDPVDPQLVLESAGFSDWLLMAALLHPEGECLRALSGYALNPAPAAGALAVETAHWGELPAGAKRPSDGTEEPPVVPGTVLPEPTDEIAPIIAELDRRLSYEYPYAALEGIAAKRAASRLTAEEADGAFQFTARPSFISGASASPVERGIAIHTFMEYADYSLAAAGVEEEIARLVNGGFISRRQADLIDRGKVAAFFESPLYARMRRADKLWREHRFITSLPLRELEPESGAPDEEIVVQGSADCLFAENGGLVIVDYKTDRSRDPAALAAHYAPQLRLYAAVAEKTLGIPVRQLLLYSFELGREAAVSLSGPGEKLESVSGA